MRLSLSITAVMFAACGGNGDSGRPVDAAIDGRPDVAQPDAQPPFLGTDHYVFEKLRLPATNDEVRAYAFDLDNSTTADNALGSVITNFIPFGFESQIAMTAALDRGDAIMLGNLGATNLTSDAMARFTIYQGENPTPSPCLGVQDTTCRKHLAGTGSFTIKPTAQVDVALQGSIDATKLTAGPGHLTIQLSMLSSPPITVTLLGARLELVTTKTTLDGKLGGAISKQDVDTKLVPALRASFQTMVARDCTMLASPPTCGCASPSQGATLVGWFDTAPHDCAISLGELQANSTLQSLLVPDVTIDSTPGLSIGVGIAAVAGSFTAPM